MPTYNFPPELIHKFLIPKYPEQEDFLFDRNAESVTLYDLLAQMLIDIAGGGGTGVPYFTVTATGKIIGPNSTKQWVPLGANVGAGGVGIPVSYAYTTDYSIGESGAQGHVDDAIEWGWTTVRLTVHNNKGVGITYAEQKDAIIAFIDEYTSRGIVVQVCLMDTGGHNFHPTENTYIHKYYATDAAGVALVDSGDGQHLSTGLSYYTDYIWPYIDDLAGLYANNPYVWWNLNEPTMMEYDNLVPRRCNCQAAGPNLPTGNLGSVWTTLQTAIYNRLRGLAPTAILVCDFADYGQGVDRVATLTYVEDFMVGKTNVVFSWHNYGFNGADAAMTGWANTIAAKNIPVVIGEFGQNFDPADFVDHLYVGSDAHTRRGTTWVLNNAWNPARAWGAIGWHGTGSFDFMGLRLTDVDGGAQGQAQGLSLFWKPSPPAGGLSAMGQGLYNLQDTKPEWVWTENDQDIVNIHSLLRDHIKKLVDAHDASAISVLDTLRSFISTNVEGALAELVAFDESLGQPKATLDIIPDLSTEPGFAKYELGSVLGTLRDTALRVGGHSTLTGAKVATNLALTPGPAVYDNAAAGVGATLTGASNLAFPLVDGIQCIVGDWVIVTQEASPQNNGLYEITDIGSGATPWVLTRVPCANAGSHFSRGLAVIIAQGLTLSGTIFWVRHASFTVGTTRLTWTTVNRADVSPADTSLGYRRSHRKYFTDFEEVTGLYGVLSTPQQIPGMPWFVNIPLASINGAAVQISVAGSPGGLQLYAGTVATAHIAAWVGQAGYSHALLNTAKFGAKFKISALSTAAEEFIFRIGFLDNQFGGSGIPANGMYFQSDPAAASPVWRCVCRSAGVETVVVTTVPVTTGNKTVAMYYDPLTGFANFYMSEPTGMILVASINATIPITAQNPGFCIKKSVGAGTTTIVTVDNFGCSMTETRANQDMLP